MTGCENNLRDSSLNLESFIEHLFLLPGSQPAIALLLLERDVGGLPEQDDLLDRLAHQVVGREVERRRASDVMDRRHRSEELVPLTEVAVRDRKLLGGLRPKDQQVEIFK